MQPPRSRIVAMLVGVSAIAVVAPSPAAGAARPIGPLSPPSGAWFGAYVNPNKSNPGGSKAEVNALESSLGRTLDIDNRFTGYSSPITTGLESWDLKHGRIPMITWGVHDTLSLASGTQDDWIRSEARDLAGLGQPMFLRFFHEFDADYRTRVVHSAADFIAAWRHVHDLFVQEGATNVVWVWCPTSWSFISKRPWPPDYYPGDRYVDWVAADGYNWYPGRPGSTWRSFKEIFGAFYAWASETGKPIMIAENGVQEDPARPGRKARWIARSRAALVNRFSLVQAVLYFDTTITKQGLTLPWIVTSTRSALRAWTAMGNDPYFDPVPDA